MRCPCLSGPDLVFSIRSADLRLYVSWFYFKAKKIPKYKHTFCFLCVVVVVLKLKVFSLIRCYNEGRIQKEG